MTQPETIRNRLLAVIAFIFIVAALRLSYPVSMPLVVAAFVITAIWPIKPYLERFCPPASAISAPCLPCSSS